MLHGVRVRVSPSAPYFKKLTLCQLFLCLKCIESFDPLRFISLLCVICCFVFAESSIFWDNSRELSDVGSKVNRKMRKLWYVLVWFQLSCFSAIGYAASLADQVLTEQAFFQLQPQQSPLSEQFSALVNSPPNPLRVSQQEPIRVVFLLFGERDAWHNQLALSAFRQRMRELGIVYRLDTYIDRTGSGVDFIPHLDVMVADSDYIVATKMSLGLKRIYERFLLANKSKLILFDFAAPIRHWLLEPPLIYLGFDQTKAVQLLASFLDRQLPRQTVMSALVLADDYLGQMRCDHFIDEMQRYGRAIADLYVIENDQQQAFLRTQSLLARSDRPDFIFSCTQNIAKGVLQALQEQPNLPVQTNVWGPFNDSVGDITSAQVKAITLLYWDDVAIAIAEAIKLDLEGRNSANLYMARSSLVPGDIDRETLSLMLQQAYHYSVKSWH